MKELIIFALKEFSLNNFILYNLEFQFNEYLKGNALKEFSLNNFIVYNLEFQLNI